MNRTLVPLREEYITLGQLLKLVGAIPTGGAARAFLATTTVYVNGEPENRRGRKLYPGDTVSFDNTTYLLTKGENP
ncbi:MAG TPA: S4 domain-containing protein YaaA [Chthonomonas sp.]|uniref:S4 domain-containing protein YaaA n=1 Tax=Chthonomonas sp. TaxID=2282153 RepID=UPI002B4ABF03|nr:S4 domain-containing protein YaaA [Chthonomonas sp.]HLI47264.1 S4 domain-containing protein YaaA [Chthonomonas sp.]